MARKTSPASVTEKEVFPLRLQELMDTPPKTSQETLAQFLGITRQAVSNYKSGQSGPDWKTLAKIAEFFNVSVDYLVNPNAVRTRDAELRAVCEYTGLTEESVEHLRSLRREYLYSTLGIPVGMWEQGAEGKEDKMDVFNALMQSNRFSRDVLSPIVNALTFKKAALELLNAEFTGCSSAEVDEVMARQDELYRELKFSFYDAVEGFRKLVDSTFLFGDIAERMDNQLNAWLMMDDKDMLEAEANYGEYQED